MYLKAIGAEPDVAEAALHTSSAAVFWDTNRTVLLEARHWAIMLAIVWLLPVPGGPKRTKSLPFAAAITAASWEESADKGAKISRGWWSRSIRSGSGKGDPSP
jgi:hypothetical protein